MSRRTVQRLKEILARTEYARSASKRDNPKASAVRGQLRRDEDALREAIELLNNQQRSD
jgi:hypothetical protein